LSEKLRGKTPLIRALSVGTSVIKLVDENPKRTGLLVYNNGSATVYILSAQNQTSSDGIPLATGASYENDNCYGAYWIVAASGTQNVRIEEDAA